MTLLTSTQWSYTLDLEDVILKTPDEEMALHWAREAESGTLEAAGGGGDWVAMQFDETHALVLYRPVGGPTLRPHFPNRKKSGEGIEDFYCACCGVQLGDWSELLSRCMSREEGFRLFREILRGQLPGSLPEPHPDQPWLSGMEFVALEEAKGRQVEWLPLKGRYREAANQTTPIARAKQPAIHQGEK